MDGALLESLFRAYFDVRKNKRNTVNQIRYELDFERNLFDLCYEIESRIYTPSRSICFMLEELGIKREIFGANFKDRIVHRLIYDQIAPLFERRFIPDSYSCRKNKGSHYAIKRLEHHIRSCSANYTRQCWILKLDIQGYFFSIDRNLLYRMISTVLSERWCEYCARQSVQYHMLDLDTVLFLIDRVIHCDATKNCIIRGTKEKWDNFPATKSLFHADPGCGLPIGNLTSQLFSNIYLDCFDQYVKRTLQIRHYGRYVDDFFIVHEDPDYLHRLIPVLRVFLQDRLHLTLHPKKIYLQSAERGVLFVGGFLKPWRNYPGHRVVARCSSMLARQQSNSALSPVKLRDSLNSYLGTIRQFRSCRIRRRIICHHNWIFQYGWMKVDFSKYRLCRQFVNSCFSSGTIPQ